MYEKEERKKEKKINGKKYNINNNKSKQFAGQTKCN